MRITHRPQVQDLGSILFIRGKMTCSRISYYIEGVFDLEF